MKKKVKKIYYNTNYKKNYILIKKEKMEKILIIEDDLWISNSLKLYLESSNYKVELYNTGKKAIEKIKQYNPNLIILDINLPEKDWMQICSELRVFSNIPIVMLTARDSEYDRISGLENWADDYIAKPFSPRELLARIKTILKRTSNIENNKNIKNKDILNYKDIKIDINKKIASLKNEELNLTKNEYDLLVKIIQEDWKVVRRELLMTEVLGYDKYIYDRTLDTHIKNLRKKITTDEEVILTVRWEWYRLNK